MATRVESLPGKTSVGSVSPTLILKDVLQMMASLQLTVVLFALAIFLVFYATLTQTEKDMWDVIKDYFIAYIAKIEIRYFFPKPWFMGTEQEYLTRLPGFFPFPGGAAIGLAMVVNLLSAHLIRFKVQAKGRSLLIGGVLTALGVAVTWAVIVSGHSAEGLQGRPPFSWDTLWTLCHLSLWAMAIGLIAGSVQVARRAGWKNPAFWMLAPTALIFLILAAWVLLSGFALSQSALRIVWQLVQGSLAGLVLLVAFLFLFRRRAGIVLIHVGVGLMMLGQLIVAKYDVEEQMRIEEGETVNFVRDIRGVELALITDADSGDQQRVTAIPLLEKSAATEWARGKQVQLEDLPITAQVVQFFENHERLPQGKGIENIATRGRGQDFGIRPKRSNSGADSSAEVDSAAAFVRFKQGDQDLGTFFLYQDMEFEEQPETLEVGDQTYQLMMRFKRDYKPHSLTLVDVRKDDYLGTSTPKNYSSDLVLTAPDGTRRDVKIWMNNPWRYAGATYYQTNYQAFPEQVTDPETGRPTTRMTEITTLSVVTNSGWMIPYVSCMIVVLGMVAHFGGTLYRFLGRISTPRSSSAEKLVPQPRAANKVPVAQVSEPPQNNKAMWLSIAICLLVGLLLPLRGLRPEQVNENAPDIYEFGSLPVTYEGRAKPYDTLARGSLRIISNREEFEDNAGNKQPAIRWLLDVISHSPVAVDHKVFRIDNPDVLNLLGLERRKRFRYALSEFQDKMDKLREQVRLAAAKDKEERSIFEKKALALDRKIQLYYQLSESHRVPDVDPENQLANVNQLLGLASLVGELDGAPVPYGVPTEDAEQPWEPVAVAATRNWIHELAEEQKVNSTQALAEVLIRGIRDDQQYVGELVDQRMKSLVEQALRQTRPDIAESQIAAEVERSFENMPADIRQQVAQGARNDVVTQLARVQVDLEQTLTRILGREMIGGAGNPSAAAMVSALRAYRQSDGPAFNEAITSYEQKLAALSPEGYAPQKVASESFFNHFAPFYQSAVLYVFVFVITAVSWLSWHKPLRAGALALLILVFLLHTFGLIMRIYISGRPPVTNLYSSTIFVGWAGVLFAIAVEFVYKRGIGNVGGAFIGFNTLMIGYFLNTQIAAHQSDTFTVMQAVLDTQFWLATHVVTISLGYSTTYLAGIFGLAYIVLGVLTPAMSKNLSRDLARMMYGIVCFAMLFSFFGTVLGGLWADDSWGRFWGWDPKENGALIIVLWNALILHARWGKMIGDRGMACLCVFGNIVVSWSWFGVNELNVGLHSYGVTEGVLLVLKYFALSQLIMLGIGLVPRKYWLSKQIAEA